MTFVNFPTFDECYVIITINKNISKLDQYCQFVQHNNFTLNFGYIAENSIKTNEKIFYQYTQINVNYTLM